MNLFFRTWSVGVGLWYGLCTLSKLTKSLLKVNFENETRFEVRRNLRMFTRERFQWMRKQKQNKI